MYFEELNGDFSAGLWRKNPNGRKDIHHGRHRGGIEVPPDDDAERRSPFTEGFLAFFSKTGRGDAFTVGFVVVCLCVSFVLVVSAVAVVQLHLKTKNSKDGEEEEEEEEEALLDGCEYGSTVRNRTGARRNKKKRKKDDESSSSLYGAIV